MKPVLLRLFVCTLIAVAPFATTPLAAQSRTMPSELRDGRSALSFFAAIGGAGVGYARMVSARTAFTFDVAGSGAFSVAEVDRDTVVDGQQSLQVWAAVEPGFRRYRAGRGDVASYWSGRLLLGIEGSIHDSDDSQSPFYADRWTPMGGLATGFGLEWFPADGFSVRGEMSMSARYSYRRERRDDGLHEIEYRNHTINAGLGQSGLAVTLWF